MSEIKNKLRFSFKNLLHFPLAFLASYIFGISAMSFLIMLVLLFQSMLNISPTPLSFYINHDGYQIVDIFLLVLGVFVFYYYHQFHSWRFLFGLVFAFNAILFGLSTVFLYSGWYFDSDFYSLFVFGSRLEEIYSPPPPFMIFFISVAFFLLFGIISLVLLKMKRVFLITLATLITASSFTVVWAKTQNVTTYCFVNGYWEYSPVYDKLINDIDITRDTHSRYGGIYYITNLYMSGPLMKGEQCYTSENQQRHEILKKHLFSFNEFPEFSTSLVDIIVKQAEQNDVPAMLLLSRMYATGFGVEQNKETSELWWNKAYQADSSDWVKQEQILAN